MQSDRPRQTANKLFLMLGFGLGLLGWSDVI